MPPLDPSQIAQALQDLPGWALNGDAIVRDYAFPDFLQAVLFVNRVCGAAETADHHPDLEVSWGAVRVRLSTHSAGGVTDRDVSLARAVDGLV